jgi:hypothetical protein
MRKKAFWRIEVSDQCKKSSTTDVKSLFTLRGRLAAGEAPLQRTLSKTFANSPRSAAVDNRKRRIQEGVGYTGFSSDYTTR